MVHQYAQELNLTDGDAVSVVSAQGRLRLTADQRCDRKAPAPLNLSDAR
jgi:hypothetical protein